MIAINLPYMGSKGLLPPRVEENISKNSNKQDTGYARYYTYPSSNEQLEAWIEDAYNARTQRAHLIKNTNVMMKYNSRCKTHNKTH